MQLKGQSMSRASLVSASAESDDLPCISPEEGALAHRPRLLCQDWHRRSVYQGGSASRVQCLHAPTETRDKRQEKESWPNLQASAHESRFSVDMPRFPTHFPVSMGRLIPTTASALSANTPTKELGMQLLSGQRKMGHWLPLIERSLNLS
jgi:hypothetical protein